MTTGMSRTPIDTSQPHSARVYDWLLGGQDNYPVDRVSAFGLGGEVFSEDFPMVAFTAPAGADFSGIKALLKQGHQRVVAVLIFAGPLPMTKTFVP